MSIKKQLTILISGTILIVIGLLFLLNDRENIHDITIIQTTDIHGHITSSGSRYSKLSKAIKYEIEKSGGLKNCLLIDCGDTFQGSYEAAKHKGSFIPRLLNDLNFNVFIPGNHDFDFGTEAFIKNISQLKCDIIAANLSIKNLPISIKIYPWKCYERNGKKIAVIGMTSPFLRYWLWGKRYQGIEVFPIKKTMFRVMPEVLKAKPDAIILAVHQGLYQSKRYPSGSDIKEIAEIFPHIDIILGGHSHQTYSGKMLSQNTMYIQAGHHGKYIAVIKLNFDNKNKTIFSKLDEIKVDKSRIASKTDQKSKLSLKQIRFLSKLKPDEFTEYFVKLISKIMKESSNTDIAFYFSRKIKLNNLNSSIKRIAYKIIPYEDNIVKINLTGNELKKFIKQQIEFNRKTKYKSLFHYSGLEIKYTNNGHIKYIYINDRKLKNQKTYSIALTSYCLASAGNRYPLLKKYSKNKNSKPVDTGILLRNSLERYLQSK